MANGLKLMKRSGGFQSIRFVRGGVTPPHEIGLL